MTSRKRQSTIHQHAEHAHRRELPRGAVTACVVLALTMTPAMAGAARLGNRLLMRSWFATDDRGISVDCDGVDCFAQAPVLSISEVRCQAPTCTYELEVCGHVVRATDGDAGTVAFWRFAIDGAPPLPGPSYSIFGDNDGLVLLGPGPWDRSCVKTLGRVRFGVHNITVQLAVYSFLSHGSLLLLPASTLTVRVYTP